jgi:hypothetical protein
MKSVFIQKIAVKKSSKFPIIEFAFLLYNLKQTEKKKREKSVIYWFYFNF